LHLLFDIFTGLGVAAAVGIRPFLPALVVGGLAAGSVQIHFKHTSLSFLQSWPFLLAVVIAGLVIVVAERRFGFTDERRPMLALLGVISAGLGALLFAGSLARGHYTWWPGLIGGALCAGIGMLATYPLFARVRARLDREAAAALPLYAEAIAILLAALSVVAPPAGLIGLLALGWLLTAGRRREGQKYAGLRILR
jgi:Domain of unknown function (DUF4126)